MEGEEEEKFFVIETKADKEKNIDQMLDGITFSDSDSDLDKGENKNFKLDKDTYNKEAKNIENLYQQNEEDEGTMNTYTCTKNEIKEPERKEIPVPFKLTANDVISSIGKVSEIVEERILVIPFKIPNKKVMNLDNIIFNKERKAIGYIDDVFGNIEHPIYVIRPYPDLAERGLQLSKYDEMFYCENKSSFVNTEEIIARYKGCDASNIFDEEVNENEMEYSDDEEEIQAKMKRKKNKRQKFEDYKPSELFNNNNNKFKQAISIVNKDFMMNNQSQQELNLQIENDIFNNMILDAVNFNFNPFDKPKCNENK